MATISVETYEAVKTLKKRGFTEEQATGVVEAMQQIDLSHLATKGDVERLERDLKAVMRELELRMTIKLGGLIVVGIGALAALRFFE